ncbi:MAG: hypothetical protein P8Z31_01305 [Gammaproteobacteria bacterium]|jgi:hypothetical protein
MADYHAEAIELARKGEWDASHRLIQSHEDALACLIHGYLHRVEGDLWNARYWYNRAGEPMPDNSLAEEMVRLTARCRE